MKDALFLTTDEEREARMSRFRPDLARETGALSDEDIARIIRKAQPEPWFGRVIERAAKRLEWLKRIDWINFAAWVGAGIVCLVFWGFVAWGILGRVL